MIKSVVFDWGGVISPAGTPDEVTVSLSKILGLNTKEVSALFTPYSDKLKRGSISETQFWFELEKVFGRSFSSADRCIWTPVKFFKPTGQLLDFIRQLQSEGLLVSILSNTFPLTAEQIRKNGWYEMFDVVILSSDVGLAKPDEQIYSLLLEKTDALATETIFVDDQERCLVPARKLGISTVLARTTQQIIDDVFRLISQ